MRLLLQKGIIRTNKEEDADLVDLRMVLRSICPRLNRMDCGNSNCGSCGVKLVTVLRSTMHVFENEGQVNAICAFNSSRMAGSS